MDLGITGRKAIVCAASMGLGRACANALAAEGVDLTICARGKDKLEAAADEIRKASGVKVTPVVADVTSEEGRSALLAACPEPDILINNAAGPPPGDFKNFSLEDWRKAVENNMISPIALVHATVYGMMDRGFGRIVTITSYTVKIPAPILELSNGARAGFTGAVGALARKVAHKNVTINQLLPGPFRTERLETTTSKLAADRGVTIEEQYKERLKEVPAKRIGNPEEFGKVAAFICSDHAGFIVGQNILVDGGSYPGMM